MSRAQSDAPLAAHFLHTYQNQGLAVKARTPSLRLEDPQKALEPTRLQATTFR